ncbi:MAG: hypothetical protein K2W93_09280 [Burkholderiaceae bacterium]|nr:hypothetical protein [Burkholderiaceae bacterium]
MNAQAQTQRNARHASTLLLAALLTGLLGACAQLPGNFSGVQPGLSTGAQLRAAQGQPDRVWPNADGTQTLEYPQQPFGTRCMMITVDANDKVLSVLDGLSPPQRARIEVGMKPEQVSRILGRERSRVYFSNSHEDVWDWNIEPDQTGYPMRFNVHFQNGTVLRTSQSMVFPTRPFRD